MRLIVFLTAACCCFAEDLSPEERTAGYISVFDGRTLKGWSAADGEAAEGVWQVEDGAIATRWPPRDRRADLLLDMPVEDFSLRFDFRLSPGSNTGVKYLVRHALRYLGAETGMTGAAGLEFQLIDAKAPGADGFAAANGGLYSLLPPRRGIAVRPGEWVSAELVCRDRRCEHRIAGQTALSFSLDDPALRRRFSEAAANPSQSVVSSLAAAAALRDYRSPSRLALQHHGSRVWFRHLRLLVYPTR